MVDHEKGHTALHKAAAYKRRTICCMLGTQPHVGAALLKSPCSVIFTLTLIPIGVTIYGSHCFKVKFLKKLLSNINLKKIANP
jgi:hypothetical protein